MSMILTTLIAVGLSAVPIFFLCIGDPKRRRSAEKKSDGMATKYRRALAAAACVPGIFCAFAGDSAAFLMWIGGCTLMGWGAALGLGVSRTDREINAAD